MLNLTVAYVPYRKAVHRGRDKTEPLIGVDLQIPQGTNADWSRYAVASHGFGDLICVRRYLRSKITSKRSRSKNGDFLTKLMRELPF